MIIEGVVIFIFIVLALMFLKSISGASRRSARLLRRVPCVTCGAGLLPAARICPNCRSKQPLRGWAGRRERMWNG
jgi:hypothetical protein